MSYNDKYDMDDNDNSQNGDVSLCRRVARNLVSRGKHIGAEIFIMAKTDLK